MRPPTMVWLDTSVSEKQGQGCSIREDKSEVKSDPSHANPGTVPQYVSRGRWDHR